MIERIDGHDTMINMYEWNQRELERMVEENPLFDPNNLDERIHTFALRNDYHVYDFEYDANPSLIIVGVTKDCKAGELLGSFLSEGLVGAVRSEVYEKGDKGRPFIRSISYFKENEELLSGVDLDFNGSHYVNTGNYDGQVKRRTRRLEKLKGEFVSEEERGQANEIKGEINCLNAASIENKNMRVTHFIVPDLMSLNCDNYVMQFLDVSLVPLISSFISSSDTVDLEYVSLVPNKIHLTDL